MEGPQVQLFVTCLIDSLAPDIGRATVASLERSGCSVGFPPDQACCGQPAYNVGLHDEARAMAVQTIEVLEDTEGPVVVPSGSCAAMIRHHYAELFGDGDMSHRAKAVSSRVRELTEFLVDDLETDVKAECGDCSVAYHYSCHGLRQLGLASQADTLLEDVERVELEDDTECCGFGGAFSVEMPSISTAMLSKKLDRIEGSGAEVLVGSDISCLMHIEGGLRRRGSDMKVAHIAELLNE